MEKRRFLQKPAKNSVFPENPQHIYAFSLLLALHLLRQHYCETRVYYYQERCLGAKLPLHFQQLQIFAVAQTGGSAARANARHPFCAACAGRSATRQCDTGSRNHATGALSDC